MIDVNRAEHLIRSVGGSTDTPIELWSSEFFLILATAAILLLVGGLFIWLYFRQKNDATLMEKYGHKSAGSFKGYWARYRGAVYGFMAAMFILFGILLFLWAFGVIQDPTTDI